MVIVLSSVRLSAQRALLRYIPANLRSVVVSVKENVVGIRFFFDGEVTERDWEIVEVVLTEIIADFYLDDQGREIEFTHDAVRCDFPTRPPQFDYEYCVYFRYEEEMYPPNIAIKKVSFMPLTLASVKLSAQRALLGYVPFKLRAVYVSVVENVIGIRFFFDGEVTEKDWEIVEVVLTEMIADFSLDDQGREIEFTHDAVRCDFPTRPPYTADEHTVYFRYEDEMYTQAHRESLSL